MSKEQKFHDLIEAQYAEECERVLQRVKKLEAERLAKLPSEPTPVAPKAKPFPWRKMWTAVASVAAAVVLVFVGVKFLPDILNPDEGRYCSTEDYTKDPTDKTIKEYALQEQKNWLYFDWYDQADDCQDYVYRLKDTGEIICYWEQIVESCTVDVFITDTRTDIDEFASDKQTDEITVIEGINVNWTYRARKAYANFEYAGYRYYLRLEYPVDENQILELVEELLG